MLMTYTGKIFDYKNISKESIDVVDIIHSLVRINRFIGHSSRSYSVAEHTYYGLLMAEDLGYTPLQKLHWFIHDFTEAYVGDCPTPLKRMLPLFSVIEEEVAWAIMEHLELEPMTDEQHAMVKRIDTTMLVLEMRDLTLHNYERYVDDSVYMDYLDDKFFNLKKELFKQDELQQILLSIFDSLLEEVRNEIV